MMLELRTVGTMPTEGFSRMRPRLESPGPYALARDDGSGIASAWRPSRRQRRTPWMAVWKREAGTDVEAQRHSVEVSSYESSITVPMQGV